MLRSWYRHSGPGLYVEGDEKAKASRRRARLPRGKQGEKTAAESKEVFLSVKSGEPFREARGFRTVHFGENGRRLILRHA